MICQFCELRV